MTPPPPHIYGMRPWTGGGVRCMPRAERVETINQNFKLLCAAAPPRAATKSLGESDTLLRRFWLRTLKSESARLANVCCVAFYGCAFEHLVERARANANSN